MMDSQNNYAGEATMNKIEQIILEIQDKLYEMRIDNNLNRTGIIGRDEKFETVIELTRHALRETVIAEGRERRGENVLV